MAGDRATLWQLIGRRPDGRCRIAASLAGTAWSRRCGTATTSTGNDHSACRRSPDRLSAQQHERSGGVDPSQPAPWYQTAFGLDAQDIGSLGACPAAATPDVSADAGGNMHYLVPGPTMAGAAAPTAAPARRRRCGPRSPAQIDAIFHDQGLPQPRLRQRPASTSPRPSRPAAFNDITLGSNTSSFALGRHRSPATASQITPTGYGYHAGAGLRPGERASARPTARCWRGR